MAKAYLILGGNQGDRKEIFRGAIRLISEMVGEIVDSSSIYESEAWGFNSDPFWNVVIVVETELLPDGLLNKILDIESEFGRTRNTSAGYCARPVDIDILFFDNLIVEEPDMVIPHPHIAKRRFVLEPLAEILSDFLHPVTGEPVSQMLEACDDNSEVRRIAD